MSLISFHKVLIATAIAFCLGFSAWELATYLTTSDPVTGLVGVGFAFVTLLLIYYFRHLSRFLGLDRAPRPMPTPDESFSSNGHNRGETNLRRADREV